MNIGNEQYSENVDNGLKILRAYISSMNSENDKIAATYLLDSLSIMMRNTPGQPKSVNPGGQNPFDDDIFKKHTGSIGGRICPTCKQPIE